MGHIIVLQGIGRHFREYEPANVHSTSDGHKRNKDYFLMSCEINWIIANVPNSSVGDVGYIIGPV